MQDNEKKEEQKGTYGGSRKGAGRRENPLRRIPASFRFSIEVYEVLSEKANKGEFVEKAILHYDKYLQKKTKKY